jgi:hypothetical protein
MKIEFKKTESRATVNRVCDVPVGYAYHNIASNVNLIRINEAHSLTENGTITYSADFIGTYVILGPAKITVTY